MSFDRSSNTRLLDAFRRQREIGTGRLDDSQAGSTVETQEELDSGNRLSRLAKFIFEPLVDVPELPGGVLGDIVETGLEEVSSPLGLGLTLLTPFTGGSSLGLKGALGIAAKGTTRVGSEVAGGGAIALLSREAAEAVEDRGPLAQLAAGLVVGGVSAAAVSRMLRATRPELLDPVMTKALNTLEESQDLAHAASTIDDPVQKFAFVIRNADELTAENAIFKSQELGSRFEKVQQEFFAGGGSPQEFQAAVANLGGDLPKAMFDPASEFIETDTFNQLHQIVTDHINKPNPIGEIITAVRGLNKIYYDGAVPAPHEVRILTEIFGLDFAEAIASRASKGDQIKQAILSALNIPRSVMASLDMSFPFRQGMMMIGQPRAFFGAFEPMFKSWGDETFFREAMEEIVTSPEVIPGYGGRSVGQLMKEAGLEITSVDGGLLNREEAVMGQLFGPLKQVNQTLFGRSIKASERAYTVAANKMRRDAFRNLLVNWSETNRSMKDLKVMAQFYNAATGRGDLPGLLKGSGPALNALMFAPKLLFSRFRAPALMFSSGISNEARIEMAKQLGIFVGTGITAMQLMRLNGIEVELDPRSSDFGKVRVGDTRYDFWAGYQPIARYTAQIITGERKTLDERIKDANRMSTLGRFFQSKAAPVPGLLIDVLRGENFMGEQLRADATTFKNQATGRLVPLFVQDLIETVNEEQGIGFAKSVPAFFGVGIQSFTTLREEQNRVAQDLFGVDYRDATGAQQTVIRNHPEVIAKIAEFEATGNEFGAAMDQTEANRISSEQIMMANFSSGTLSPKDFADAVEDVNQRAAIRREAHRTDFGIEIVDPGSPLQAALSGYFDLYAQADAGAEAGIRTGVIDWEKFDDLEHQYLGSLSEAQRQFVDARARAQHDPTVQWYFDAKELISNSGYYDITDEVFDRKFQRLAMSISRDLTSFNDVVQAKNLADRRGDVTTSRRLNRIVQAVQRETSQRRLRLRRRNRDLDVALFTIGRTSTLVSR